jgi:alkaline phosphatase D
MRFVDLYHKGYVVLDADAERLQAEFWHVDTIERRAPDESLAAVHATASGADHLEPGSGPAPDGEMQEPAP